jgi:hypothetical protein
MEKLPASYPTGVRRKRRSEFEIALGEELPLDD